MSARGEGRESLASLPFSCRAVSSADTPAAAGRHPHGPRLPRTQLRSGTLFRSQLRGRPSTRILSRSCERLSPINVSKSGVGEELLVRGRGSQYELGWGREMSRPRTWQRFVVVNRRQVRGRWESGWRAAGARACGPREWVRGQPGAQPSGACGDKLAGTFVRTRDGRASPAEALAEGLEAGKRGVSLLGGGHAAGDV